MISVARMTNRNLTRWRNGQMVRRWTAAGMLNAERSFRRIKGHKQMPQLMNALRRHAHPETGTDNQTCGYRRRGRCSACDPIHCALTQAWTDATSSGLGVSLNRAASLIRQMISRTHAAAAAC